MDFYDGFASSMMLQKVVEVLWKQTEQLFPTSAPIHGLLKSALVNVDERFPPGLMKLIFSTVSIFGMCIQLTSKDLETNKTSSLTFCSPSFCDGCKTKLKLACSVTPTFLLLMNIADEHGKMRSLPATDLYQCLNFVRAKHFGYTIPQNGKVLINDDDSLLAAVQRVYKKGDTILFVAPDGCHNICKSLNSRLRTKDLKYEYVFRNAKRLHKFLKKEVIDQIKNQSTRFMKNAPFWKAGKRYMVIDFTHDPNVFTSIDPDLRQHFYYFKCPLASISASTVQEIIGFAENPNQLYELAIGGGNKIKHDPLNLMNVTSK